jgi:DNA replication initiation complex subunit (GINS family)
MLTFEKIRELERKEREENKLQKLPDDFMDELNDYLKKKEGVADQREIKNIKNIIERFFELRENKIFDFVLYSVRTGMPVENLAAWEEGFFKKLVEELKWFKQELMKENPKEIMDKKEFYRVRKGIPAVVGPDLKEYKLSENEIIDITKLPKGLNELLLKKGVIEKVD